jgi:hypothetical protein
MSSDPAKNKKPEKVQVKFRQTGQGQNLDFTNLNQIVSKLFVAAEKATKLKAFFTREDVKKTVTLLSVSLAPVVIMSLFLPLLLRSFGIVLTVLSVPEPFTKLIVYILMVPLTVYLINFMIKFYGWPKGQIIKLNKLKLNDATKVAAALLGYVLISAAAFYALAKLNIVPKNLLQQAQNIGFDKNQSVLGLIRIFIMVVIIPPIVEELLFRGLGFLNLRRLISFWPAAIHSSLLFALYHGQLNVGLDTFILGLFMAWAVEKTGSLYSSMAIHFIKNAVAFYILFLR